MATITIRILFAAASLALLLAACGESPEERAGDATKMTVETDQGAMTVQSGEGLSLPTDFPADVYLPSGYKVQNVMQIGPMNSVVLGLSGQSQALIKEITGKMESSGWKTAMSMQSGGQGAMMSFIKDKRSATYSLSPAQEAGKLTLSVQHATESN